MLDLIPEIEVNHLSLRKKKNRFYLYNKALKSRIPYFHEEIKNANNKIIIFTSDIMSRMLGEQFMNVGYRAIYNGIKYVLWRYDIHVSLRTNTEMEKVFVLRTRLASDTVPLEYQEAEYDDGED
jgi:hypothetical protein